MPERAGVRIVRRPVVDAPGLPADMNPVLRRIYAARGLRAASDLDLGLANLLGFERLKHIDAAADLLARALREGWRILVLGDFDADGATATALAVDGLRQLGATAVDYLIPDRVRHGYGLSPAIVAAAAAYRPDLIVTVDNGVSSIDGVAAARAQGIRVLVTDHHLPGPVLPAADALVNPNQPGCGFGSRALCGVGVLFYVLLALRARLRADGWFASRLEPALADYLDLVAIGTVADVVALDGNNRILVEQGLRRIRAGRARAGVYALARAAGRDPARLRAADIGFFLAPRLNAAGRLDDMRLGVACLLAEPAEADARAQHLNTLNSQRRGLQEDMQEQALAAIAAADARLPAGLPAGLCVTDPDWHEGIVGLVAGAVRERHHRPAVALAPGGEAGMLKGSARSIPGVHIRDLIENIATRNPGLIERFGGHAAAAGLTLAADRFSEFQQAFAAETARRVTPEMLAGVYETDGELELSEMNLDTARVLHDAGPWGAGFPEPLFDGHFTVHQQRIVGERHLKLRLKVSGGEAPVDAIAFRRTRPLPADRPVRLVYRAQANRYRDTESLQLVVVHAAAAPE